MVSSNREKMDEFIRQLTLQERRELIVRLQRSIDPSGPLSTQPNEGSTDAIGHQMDEFIGDWDKEQTEQMLEHLDYCRQIDPEMWK